MPTWAAVSKPTRLLKLAADMQHVEAVLKMFNPEFNVAGIAAHRRQKTNLLVQAGHPVPGSFERAPDGR